MSADLKPYDGAGAIARLWPHVDEVHSSEGETGPLALCIALLKTLQAQTDGALKPEGGET